MIEIIEKKSKFITYAFILNSEGQVDEILSSLRKEHKKATHICYAYNFFGHSKYSDDNEPSGTAGSPILNVIMKNGLTNVLIAVVRYFGGIKLGAGGLTRAYSNCASEIIKRESIKNLEKYINITFSVEFSEQKIIETMSHYDYVKSISYSYNDKVLVNIVIKPEYLMQYLGNTSNRLNKTINVLTKREVFL